MPKYLIIFVKIVLYKKLKMILENIIIVVKIVKEIRIILEILKIKKKALNVLKKKKIQN